MTLIEKLKIHRSRYYQEVAIAEDVIGECIEIAEEHSDWVSVDERLPTHSGRYLVWHSQDQVDTKIFNRPNIAYYCCASKHFDFFNGLITNWQNSPKPPSEVQDA